MAKIEVEGLEASDGVVFGAIPAGRYPVRIVKVEDKETGPNAKVPGQPMLSLVLKVTADCEDHADEQLFFNSVHPNDTMSEKGKKMATAKLKQLIIAAGLDIEGDSFDTSDLYGCEICAIVTCKTSDGKESNNVQEFLPLEDMEG